MTVAETKGTRHELIVLDDPAKAEDQPTPTKQKERYPFIVKSKAGLFKNGQQYDNGETIMLDADTAARFKDNGDIE